LVALVQGQAVAICARTVSAAVGSLQAAGAFLAGAAIRPITKSKKVFVAVMAPSMVASSCDLYARQSESVK
jgi:hypothetical protein